jgi:hypothetical protein
MATSDAFKALILFERPHVLVHEQVGTQSRKNERGGRSQQASCVVCTARAKTIEEQRKDTELLLAIALFFCNSFHECLEILESSYGESAEKLQNVAKQGLEQERKFHLKNGLNKEAADEALRSGTIRWTLYPWTRKDLLHRTAETMAPLKACLERESEGSCAIKRSKTIGTSDTQNGRKTDPNEVWGIFARRDIQEGEPIFRNSTSFVCCSDSARCSGCGNNSKADGIQLSCCSRVFCLARCVETSVGGWHDSGDCIGPPTIEKLLRPGVEN